MSHTAREESTTCHIKLEEKDPYQLGLQNARPIGYCQCLQNTQNYIRHYIVP